MFKFISRLFEAKQPPVVEEPLSEEMASLFTKIISDTKSGKLKWTKDLNMPSRYDLTITFNSIANEIEYRLWYTSRPLDQSDLTISDHSTSTTITIDLMNKEGESFYKDLSDCIYNELYALEAKQKEDKLKNESRLINNILSS